MLAALLAFACLATSTLAKFDNAPAAATFNSAAKTLSGQFYITNVETSQGIQFNPGFDFWPSATPSPIWIAATKNGSAVTISPDKKKCMSAQWSYDLGADWVRLSASVRKGCSSFKPGCGHVRLHRRLYDRNASTGQAVSAHSVYGSRSSHCVRLWLLVPLESKADTYQYVEPALGSQRSPHAQYRRRRP
jgi:hypothetical protein